MFSSRYFCRWCKLASGPQHGSGELEDRTEKQKTEKQNLTLNIPTQGKKNLNLYFHTSFWCHKRFHENLIKDKKALVCFYASQRFRHHKYKYMEKTTSCNYPANIYLFQANKRNTRKRCEISSKLTIKASERGLVIME